MIAPGQLIYIEQKSGHQHDGPAWITAARLSKSGRTIWFDGRALKRAIGGGIRGNHVCAETGEEFWISGVKRDGGDRHWAGSGPIRVDARVLEDYLRLRGVRALDPLRYVVDRDLRDTDVTAFHERENAPLDDQHRDTGTSGGRRDRGPASP